MSVFLYKTKEERERTVGELLSCARVARSRVERHWKLYDDYYEGLRGKSNQFRDDFESENVEIAVSDPFIQIESQLNTAVPEPRFSGRDTGIDDAQKAKQREYVVKSILYKNDFESKNAVNERQMRIYGDSFVKVYFDINADFDGGVNDGDIVVDVVNIEDVYVDPSAPDVDSAEYIDYVYRIHTRKAWRIWRKELKKAGFTSEEFYGAQGTGAPESTLSKTRSIGDTVEVIEHWYRDDEGDIACSVQILGKEVRHIGKYWAKTGSQNKRYPFVQFYRIKKLRDFWNRSELAPIISYVDAADRLFSDALTSMDYNAEDMLFVEENALAEGEEIECKPGSITRLKEGKINAVRRLGGVNKLGEFGADITFIQSQIERTLRNYDTNNGADTAKQRTASGLSMLRADAATQASIKDKDRDNAFKRLFKLIDWTALEFYDDDRLIYIGCPDGTKFNQDGMAENLDLKRGPVFFTFNSANMAEERLLDIDVAEENGELIEKQTRESYYPAVDVEITASAAMQKSKSFTISALESLLGIQIGATNYKIVKAIIKELELPQTAELLDWIDQCFAPRVTSSPELDRALITSLTPEQQALLRNNPALMEELERQMGSEMNEAPETTGAPRLI